MHSTIQADLAAQHIRDLRSRASAFRRAREARLARRARRARTPSGGGAGQIR